MAILMEIPHLIFSSLLTALPKDNWPFLLKAVLRAAVVPPSSFSGTRT